MSILSGFRLWLPATFARSGYFRRDCGMDARVVHQVIRSKGQAVLSGTAEEYHQGKFVLCATEDIEVPGEAVADALAIRCPILLDVSEREGELDSAQTSGGRRNGQGEAFAFALPIQYGTLMVIKGDVDLHYG